MPFLRSPVDPKIRHLKDKLATFRKQIGDLKARNRAMAERIAEVKSERGVEREILRQTLRLKTGANGAESVQDVELVCSDSQPFKAVAVSLDGMKLFVPERASAEANDKLFDRTVQKREWPIDTVGSLMPFAHGEVMFDIGANIGTTSFPRAILGAFRHIHAFEPEPRNFACLARGIEANGLSDRMTAWPLAVAAQSGEIGFRVRRGIGRHHVTKAKKAEVTVKVTTLDDWIAREGIDRETIDFVKVDTQGYEMFVLGGAKHLLEARRAVWQLELSPSYMRAAGAGMDALQNLLALHFSRFLDLRNPARQLQPMSAIGDTIAALERGHTDIITLP